jgi:hypothetical protein
MLLASQEFLSVYGGPSTQNAVLAQHCGSHQVSSKAVLSSGTRMTGKPHHQPFPLAALRNRFVSFESLGKSIRE